MNKKNNHSPGGFVGGAFLPAALFFAGVFFAGVFFAGPAMAQERLQVQVVSGYQRADLRWSIAGNSSGSDPNVYSELKWKGVSGVGLGADISWRVWKKWMVFGRFSRVSTVSGKVSDTDYGGDNRTNPVYKESFDASTGYEYAGDFGVGYEFVFGWGILRPFAGYGWNGQRLSIEGAGGLDSRYQTLWRGPLVRISGEVGLGGRWGLIAEGGYHQISYRGKADWNLIQSFEHPVSFRHWGDGYGVSGKLGIKYRVKRGFDVLLAGDYFAWRTGKGVDELYLATGQTSQTQLNEVVLTGFGLKAGVRWDLR